MPDVESLVEGVRAGDAGRGLAGDHAGRVDLARGTASRPVELLTALAEGDGPGLPAPTVRVGISGVPGVGQVHLHRGARHPADRRRVTGSASWPSTRPAFAPAARCWATRPGWRSSSADPDAYIRPSPTAGTLGGVARATVQAMAGARGGGVRRRAGRDGRGRPVRGHRRRHGRHLPVPHPGPHRRPAPGHQEGHPRDRRRDRGQQGRRRPRDRGQGGRPRARRRAASGARSRRVGAARGDLLGAARRRRRRRVGAGARAPRAPGGRGARRQARRPAARVHLGAGPRRARAAAAPLAAASAAVRDEIRDAVLAGELPATVAADRILAAYDLGNGATPPQG